MKRIKWKIRKFEQKLRRIDVLSGLGCCLVFVGLLSILIGMGSVNDANPLVVSFFLMIVGALTIFIGNKLIDWRLFE